MKELRIQVSDALHTEARTVKQRVTVIRCFVVPTIVEFVESHRLLLAQALAQELFSIDKVSYGLINCG